MTILDYKFACTEVGFLWLEEDMGGIPLLTDPEGQVFEPLFRYFAYAWKNRLFRCKSSMNPVKYSIREFLFHLHVTNVKWTKVSDEVLRSYRRALMARVKEGQISQARVDLKLLHVFEFYRIIPAAMPFVNRGREMIQFVGREGDGAPITSKQITKKRRSGRITHSLLWAGADLVSSASPKRPTPSFDDVERLLEHLRSRTTGPGKNSPRNDVEVWIGERNWLIARCMVEAGLRRAEVADLSPWELAKALGRHGILIFPQKLQGSTNPLLDAMTNDSAQQDIMGKIDAHKHRGYKTFSVTVTKKGGGSRSFDMPIDLMVDLIRIGIWTIRKELEQTWNNKRLSVDYNALFFSSKRPGAKLSPGAIGDITKDAFNTLVIAGSGHRLRAYYLTHMAWLLWNEYSALNGYRFDVAVENQVLDRLADLAGHKQPGTVERHYLDMAQLLYKSKQNKPRLDAASEAMNALRRASVTLPAKDLRLIEEIISRLEDPENLMFRAVLEGVIGRFPSRAIQAKKKSHLRSVEIDH